jgi:hypothetical protein
MRETLNSFLFYAITESIEPVSDSDLIEWAIDAANDGLFSIPTGVDFEAEIARARVESRQWLDSYYGKNNDSSV